jgi:hypothetical protein
MLTNASTNRELQGPYRAWFAVDCPFSTWRSKYGLPGHNFRLHCSDACESDVARKLGSFASDPFPKSSQTDILLTPDLKLIAWGPARAIGGPLVAITSFHLWNQRQLH